MGPRGGAADVDGSGSSTKEEGTNPELVGVHRRAGGDCPGSGRLVIDGDQEFLVPVG